MIEADVRAAFAAFDGVGGVEVWLAARPWTAKGWAFQLAVEPEGLRVAAFLPGRSDRMARTVPVPQRKPNRRR